MCIYFFFFHLLSQETNFHIHIYYIIEFWLHPRDGVLDPTPHQKFAKLTKFCTLFGLEGSITSSFSEWSHDNFYIISLFLFLLTKPTYLGYLETIPFFLSSYKPDNIYQYTFYILRLLRVTMICCCSLTTKWTTGAVSGSTMLTFNAPGNS